MSCPITALSEQHTSGEGVAKANWACRLSVTRVGCDDGVADKHDAGRLNVPSSRTGEFKQCRIARAAFRTFTYRHPGCHLEPGRRGRGGSYRFAAALA